MQRHFRHEPQLIFFEKGLVVELEMENTDNATFLHARNETTLLDQDSAHHCLEPYLPVNKVLFVFSVFSRM
jgi:hypothetical protein